MQNLNRLQRFTAENFSTLVVGLLTAMFSGVVTITIGAGLWCYSVRVDIADIRVQANTFPGVITDIKALIAAQNEHIAILDERIIDHGSRIGTIEGRLSSK